MMSAASELEHNKVGRLLQCVDLRLSTERRKRSRWLIDRCRVYLTKEMFYSLLFSFCPHLILAVLAHQYLASLLRVRPQW